MVKPLIILATCVFFHLPSIAWTENTELSTSMTTNALGQEKSPYLLQHKDNPVAWLPWGEAAFAKAKTENKPIFLSIGYSTCYWCHVMEKDSFEIKEVADVLNEHFVSIKVDREERPDVDKVYMDAIVAMTGHGGWPMSVFLTHDRKPFFGGTFFPREQFIPLLENIATSWSSKREQIEQSSVELTQALQQRAKVSNPGSSELNKELFPKSLSAFSAIYDKSYGGFGAAPKFPRTENISLLLALHKKLQAPEALEMATFTLKSMSYGGIYDHLGGGYSRYSTDQKWLVPHFEKMLYDNALITLANLEAYQITANELFSSVSKETLNYVIREMMAPNGGFYSAQDAGEVGKEGEYYVWDWKELESRLDPRELKRFAEVFSISTEGNFEHGQNIISLKTDSLWSVKSEPEIASAMEKLFSARSKRVAPHKDDKILTAWNGLMISAMARGYRVLGDKRYLEAAEKAANFIQKNLYVDNKLLRRYRDGDSRFAAYLDDYSYLIAGLVDLYQASYESKWLLWAKELQEKQNELFWDSETGGYYYSSQTDDSLIVRSKELEDGAIPSANAISLKNLLLLNAFFFEKTYLKLANELMSLYGPLVDRYPPGFSSAIAAIDFHHSPSKEVAVVGNLQSKEALEFQAFLKETYLPHVVSGYGEPVEFDDKQSPALFRGKQILGGKTTFYVCENHTCKLPTNDPEQAKKLVLK